MNDFVEQLPAIRWLRGRRMDSLPQDAPEWEQFRELMFPGEAIHLNPGMLGRRSQVVHEAELSYACLERRASPHELYSFGRSMAARVAEKAGMVLGVSPDAVAVTGGATSIAFRLTEVCAWAFGGSGPVRVVTTHHEHEGGIGPFVQDSRFAVHALGDEKLRLPSAVAARVEAMGARIVFLSHREYSRCRLISVGELVDAVASQVPDVLCVVDACQTMGIRPLPATRGITFASAHKWLFGPQGTGLLWVRGGLPSGLEVLADERALGSSHGGGPLAHLFGAAGGGNFGRYGALDAALTLLLVLGVERVTARAATLGQFLRERLEAVLRGLSVGYFVEGTEPESFLLCFDEIDPYPLWEYLAQRQVFVKCIKEGGGGSPRYWGLRFGVPYYESLERLGRVAEIVREGVVWMRGIDL